MTEQKPIIRGEFGPRMREYRVARKVTLRAFCDRAGADPGNYSRIERGLFQPPPDEVVKGYVQALGFDPDGGEAQDLLDLAALDRGHLPEDLLRDDQVVGELPLLFRSLRGEPMTEAQLDQLVDLIRRKQKSEHPR